MIKIVVCLGAVGVAGFLSYTFLQSKSSDIPLVDASAKQLVSHYDTPAGLCPWRDQDADLRAFFPTADSHQERLIPLSSDRLEVEKRLGRRPTGEELGYPVHIIERAKDPVGYIVAKRVRGESGLIEIVLAIDKAGTLTNWKIQRLREPEAVERFLRSEPFHQAFLGKGEGSSFALQSTTPTEARKSAEAIAESVRTVLALHPIALKNSTKLRQQ